MSLDVAAQRDAGVVDDDVDAAEVGDDRGGVLRPGVAVADVELVDADLCPVACSTRPAVSCSPGESTSERASTAPRRGGLERQGPADARGRAGDDDDLVLQRSHPPTLLLRPDAASVGSIVSSTR